MSFETKTNSPSFPLRIAHEMSEFFEFEPILNNRNNDQEKSRSLKNLPIAIAKHVAAGFSSLNLPNDSKEIILENLVGMIFTNNRLGQFKIDRATDQKLEQENLLAAVKEHLTDNYLLKPNSATKAMDSENLAKKTLGVQTQ